MTLTKSIGSLLPTVNLTLLSTVQFLTPNIGHVLNSLRTSPLGYGVKLMGSFKCENNDRLTFNIPEHFITSNSEFPLYNYVELQLRSSDSLNNAPLSYTVFSVVNIVLVCLTMSFVLCKKDKFFINPKMK